MTSSRFDPDSTSVRPQKSWISPFYGLMNSPGLKTLVLSWNLIPTKDFVVQADPKFCFTKIFLSSQTHSLKKVEVYVSSYRALKRFNLLTYNATVEIYIEFLINYLVILCIYMDTFLKRVINMCILIPT